MCLNWSPRLPFNFTVIHIAVIGLWGVSVVVFQRAVILNTADNSLDTILRQIHEQCLISREIHLILYPMVEGKRRHIHVLCSL